MTDDTTSGGALADTLPAGNDTVPAGGANDTVPAGNSEPPAPIDWRKQIAGEDVDALKTLERFSTPSDLYKSYQEIRSKISSGEFKRGMPKDADEATLAEWRKENGVPDTPDGYKLNLPDGVVVGEADKPLWDLFLANANQMNLTQSELDKVAPAYYAMEAALREQQDKDMKEAHRNNEAGLKQKWGSDYDQNITINENFLTKSGGDALKSLLVGAVASDGSPLFNHPEFASFLNERARLEGFVDNMKYGNGDAMGGVETELATLNKLMGDRQSEYWRGPNAAKHQERYRELLNIKQKFSAN